MSQPFYGEFDRQAYGDQAVERSDERSPFQRDRDRVVFSYAFRRLQSKTQVFQSGEYDFYRTRLTHSLEVARISRSIGERLNRHYPEVQLDCDLLEAIGLAHDLGHPPFGHIGERKLNALMKPWGGFEGNAQTARILTKTFWQRNNAPLGMLPSRAFLDGVMKYKALWSECDPAPENHFLYDQQAPLRDFIAGGAWPVGIQLEQANAMKSLECQIMDWADDTAYSLHDIVDGVKAGYLTRAAVENWASQATGKHRELVDTPALKQLLERIEETDYLEASFEKKLGLFLNATRLEPAEGPLSHLSARYRWRVEVPDEVQSECALYKAIALDLVFCSPRIQQVEFKSGFLLERMFEALLECHLKQGQKGLKLLPEPALSWVEQATDEAERARLICDAVAQLTDHEALRMYRRLFDPEFGSITDLL
ncbi:MAG: dGTP triphosphohydrolase [Verrucomicrobiota bacterium]